MMGEAEQKHSLRTGSEGQPRAAQLPTQVQGGTMPTTWRRTLGDANPFPTQSWDFSDTWIPQVEALENDWFQFF